LKIENDLRQNNCQLFDKSESAESKKICIFATVNIIKICIMNTDVLSKNRINKVVYGYKDTLNETKQTAPLIDDDDFEDDDTIEDAYFMEILKEREKEEDMPDGLEILKKRRNERQNQAVLF
jgi:hypothetical protein